ncbi:MAG: fused MFS/spermidine synthase [candidate division NC10 bacterium]|nr:fused MFS/spermidine synthase [candidate division NC10 bacterium]
MEGPSGARERRQIARAILVCFFASGATGLVYEVVWTRMLGLIFGNTVHAVTAVLAAFFAGLALGSVLFGRVSDRWRRPLALYAWLEAGIGLTCLAIPLLFAAVERLALPFYQGTRDQPLLYSLLLFFLVFAVLLVPTTLMGGSLPALSRHFIRHLGDLGSRLGSLYAVNTFGAVLGAAGAGFLLLPVLGVARTIAAAATLNIGIGALTWTFDRHLRRLDREEPPPAFPAVPEVSAPLVGTQALVAVAAFTVSGAVSMVYEIAWTRVLALVVGSSVYAFSTMLTTFLVGLAAGSLAFSRWARRRPITLATLGVLELGIGAAALALLPIFEVLPSLVLGIFRAFSLSFEALLVAQFVVSLLVMLPPTLLLGATFPCVVALCTPRLEALGATVGRIYALNTLGAIAGSFVTGFFLVQALGTQQTLLLAIAINLGLGALLVALGVHRGPARLAAGAAAAALVLLAVLQPAWDRRVMASGVAVYAPRLLAALPRASFREVVASRNRLLYFKEGLAATISVHENGRQRFLRTNGKTDASTGSDMHTQLMLGHLPLLVHPDPKRVLVIGLGSGVTVGAVAQHPVETVEVAEIEPAVLEAAAFFARENRRVLQDPRVRLVVADGRNYVRTAPRPYDVVISEPSDPWISGIANLFSVEFYETVRERLTPDGIICQWIPAYYLSPWDLRMVVRTLLRVFPSATMWQTNRGDLLFLGQVRPAALDAARLTARVQGSGTIREDFTRLGFEDPLTVLGDFLLGSEDLRRYAGEGPLNTDDLPLLEFSAPRSLFRQTEAMNERLVRSFRTQEFPALSHLPPGALQSPAFRVGIGRLFLAKDRTDEALQQFEAALRRDPRSVPALTARGEVLARLGQVLRAQADMEATLKLDPGNPAARLALARLYKGQGLLDRAHGHLRAAARANGAVASEAFTLLGELLLRDGRAAEARKSFQGAVALRPEDAGSWSLLGVALEREGTLSEAIAAHRRAAELDGFSPTFQTRLARALRGAGQLEEALREAGEAAALDPLQVEPYLELAAIHKARRDLRAAAAALERALRADPGNVQALTDLERVLTTMESRS